MTRELEQDIRDEFNRLTSSLNEGMQEAIADFWITKIKLILLEVKNKQYDKKN